MRPILLALFLSACGGRALDNPMPCCTDQGGMLTCRDDACPELAHGKECTTLALDHTCQVPLTNDCQAVTLERTRSASHATFQTVYCF